MRFKELIYVSNLLASEIKHGRFYRIIKMSAVVGVAIGTMALLISMAILQGFEDKMRENATKFTSQIKVETYKINRIDDYPIICEIIKEKFPHITAIAPYLQKEVLISSKADIDGIMMKCINPDMEITGISDKIISGHAPKRNTNQVVIGERLANKLRLNVGGKVNVYMAMNTEENFPEVEKFEIAGIYRSGMAKYDDIVVYADLEYMQKIVRFSPDQCTGLDIMVDSLAHIESTSKALEKFLDFPYMCANVFELHSSMFAWIDLQKEPIPLVLALITIVAAMNIITILLVLIVEKVHSIGILRAIGMRNRDILLAIVSRGLAIGTTGTVCGISISLLFCYLQRDFEIIKLNGEIYFLDALPISIVPENFVLITVFSLAVVALATILPALIATKVTTIKALNFN